MGKMRLLLALTVALVATGVHGLKCYNCAGEDCTTELECPSDSDACLKATASLGGLSSTTKSCGLKAVEANCGESNGVCACTTDLCNAAVKPGAGTLSAVILFAT